MTTPKSFFYIAFYLSFGRVLINTYQAHIHKNAFTVDTETSQILNVLETRRQLEGG